MAFKLFEISTQAGRPIGLYEFTWGNTIWRYTSADRDIEYPAGSDQIWTAVAIKDNGVTQGPSPVEFTVNLPANLPLVPLFRSTPPAESIWLRVFRFHHGDTQAQAFWIGTVGNVKRIGIAKAEIVGLPISGTLRRTGLRLCWERQCPYMLYDGDCKVNRAAFSVDAVVMTLNANNFSVNTLGAWAGQAFVGGFFEWEVNADGTVDRRGIDAFIGGTTFRIFGSADRLTVGKAITLYLGCDLSPETCQNTFNNLSNHGGYRFMPGKSPFDGTPVF